MNIQIPSEILDQIKKLGDQTRKEIEDKIIKISRQNDKTVLSLGNERMYIDKKTDSIDKRRIR